jgi:Fe2+ transport system protein FeoA
MADFRAYLAAMGIDSAEELHERLIAEPESFSIDQLQDMIKLTADRTGHGPKQTTVNVNVDLSARLQAARRRVAEMPLIEGTVVQVAESAPPPDEEPVP